VAKIQKDRTVKETRFGISNHININFRDYALYVLENRGIPCFYDALTNVQRVSLMNAPKSFDKTIGLIGSCIKDGYHHGDASLAKAINKLARPFGCAEQLLLGDGFFGTPVNPDASASRYTSVKINPMISKIIGEHMVLNYKNEENRWDYLRTEIPIGLLTSVIGVAVGYKSTILPRKKEEIEKFLDGKKANLTPYFKDFSGKVSSYNGLQKSWLIESSLEINDTYKTIRITNIPPLMKYSSFIKKLSKIQDYNIEFVIQNDSADDVDITLIYKKGESWNDFRERIEKITKIIVTETMIFVKDSSVVEYTDIADYLTDYKLHREHVRLEQCEYDLVVFDERLEFYKAKLKYLKFMIAKKRTDGEIETFLTQFIQTIKTKLEGIPLKDLSPQTITKTEEKIKEITNNVKETTVLNKTILKNIIELEKTVGKSTTTKTKASINLMDEDSDDIDGIERFNSRSYDKDEETEDENDEDEDE
jgi:hypothetical protein